jgi:hypothetical protein
MPLVNSGGAGVGLQTAVVFSDNMDIRAIGNHDAPWTSIQNNPQDATPLTSAPPGLGLSITADGAHPNISLLVDGAWAYELSIALITGVDATLKAWAGVSGQLASYPFGPIAAGAELLQLGPSCSGVFSGSAGSGDVIRARVHTDATATANPYNVTAALFLVRIA